MAKIFKTRVDLENELNSRVKTALDETYDFLLDKLMEIIERDIYSVPEGYFYIRTEDLLNKDNWEIKHYQYAGKYYFKLSFKDDNLTPPQHNGDIHSPLSYIHGNYLDGVLPPQVFLKILNNELPQGKAFNFPYVERKPFWDDFINYCDKNFSKLFAIRCKRNGIPMDTAYQRMKR